MRTTQISANYRPTGRIAGCRYQAAPSAERHRKARVPGGLRRGQPEAGR